MASPLLGDELVLSAVCNNTDDHVYPVRWQRDTKKLQYMIYGNKVTFSSTAGSIRVLKEIICFVIAKFCLYE